MTNERKVEVLNTLLEIRNQMLDMIKKELKTIKWATNNIKEIDELMMKLKGDENGN